MPQRQKNLLLQSFDCEAIKILQDSVDADEQKKGIAVNDAVGKLVDTYGTARDAAEKIIVEFKEVAEGLHIKLRKEAAENANLAGYYFNGVKGFPKDYFLAFKYALKGAQGGSSSAQWIVATMYKMGLGTDPDLSEARRWCTLSAEQGNPASCYNLATMYELGQGDLPKDLEIAFKYYKKAADLGHHASFYMVGKCFFFGDGAKMDHDKANEYYSKALVYFKSKVDSGNATGLDLYRLAVMFENGYGTSKSDEKAMQLYKRSVEKNEVNSLDALGRFYEWGKGGLKIDCEEALRLYTLSSEEGSDSAYYHLGELYYNGKGVVKDNAKAAKFYEEAAKRGYYSAINKLAEMSLTGDGIPQNIEKALILYENGINRGIPAYLYDAALWF
jgi:TPR repeat protein